MHRSIRLLTVVLVVFEILAWLTPASAQADRLVLGVSRDWGFSAGSRIQGRFTLSVAGPDNLTAVTYYIDGQEMGTVTKKPFRLPFDTGTYPPGRHVLKAVGTRAGGATIESQELAADLLSGAAAYTETTRIIIPLVGGVLLVTLLGVGGTLLLQARRGGRGAGATEVPINYGIAGGAICPKCTRPFARHAFGLNLVTGKLERCPHCGRWSIVRAARPEELRAAEEAMRSGSRPTVPETSPEEKLRRQIQDSRYQ